MNTLEPCGRCGAVHGPWGMHAPTNSWQYEVWVDTGGHIQSALSSNGNETSPTHAGSRIAGMLEDFLVKIEPDRLALKCVAMNLGFDNEGSWGLGYGPLGASEELLRPLETLIDHALGDLQR